MDFMLSGRRRAGKSRMGAILAIYLSIKFKAPLYTTDKKVVEVGLGERETLETFKEEKRSIHYLPELWRQIDSRDWKNNQIASHLWQLQGHNDIILLHDTQLRSQIDLRIRETCDYEIFCQKKINENEIWFKYVFIDGYSQTKLKELYMPQKEFEFINNYYDSFGLPYLIE